MANDGSIASLTEQWIVDTLRATAAVPDDQCILWEGSLDWQDGARIIAELKAKRTPFVFVSFEGDRAVELEEGQNRYEAIYGIYAVVQNRRGRGEARVGDGTNLGVNGLRDVIRTALHDQAPDKGANGFYTDRTKFTVCTIVHQERGCFIMRCELAVEESPAAA